MARLTFDYLLLTIFLYIIHLDSSRCVRIISQNEHIVQMRKLHDSERRIEDAAGHHLVKRDVSVSADSGSCQPKNDTFQTNLAQLTGNGRKLANEVTIKNWGFNINVYFTAFCSISIVHANVLQSQCSVLQTCYHGTYQLHNINTITMYRNDKLSCAIEYSIYIRPNIRPIVSFYDNFPIMACFIILFCA